jgi:hypothetical protein
MTAREELERATRRLQELAGRIEDAADRPAPEIEELARQASDLSAAVVEIIPRAIAEAEADARGDRQVAVAPDAPHAGAGPSAGAEPA